MIAPARRLVVFYDSVASSDADAAVELARQLGAELEGVFVEDEDLVRSAALPFAAIVHGSGASRAISPPDVERAFRVAAIEAERALTRAALPLSVTVTFRVERGRLDATILARAPETILVMGRGRRAKPRRPEITNPVVFLVLGPEDKALLPIGADLGADQPLLLLTTEPGAEAAVALRKALPRAHITRAPAESIPEILARARPRIVVIHVPSTGDGDTTVLHGSRLRWLTLMRAQLSCPILVVTTSLAPQ